jgi:hypothetical protein
MDRYVRATGGCIALLLVLAPPALAGDFSPGVGNFVGGDVMDVAAGDLNRDGRPDLATAVELLPAVSTLLNSGNGFGAPAELKGTGRPYSLTVADLDDDGRLDMAVTNIDEGVWVHLGRGDGRFREPVLYRTGLAPSDVKAGDLNGDGRLDLAVVDNGSESVSVLLGRGDGSFGPPISAPVGGDYPQQLALADLNRDGRLDVAVTVANAAALVVLLGHGDGHLSAPAFYRAPEFHGWSPIGVTAADFDRDGLVDVAESIGDLVWVWPGRGDGTLGSPAGAFAYPEGEYASARDVAAADFNGDGRLDLAVANGGTSRSPSKLTVLHGRGDGTLEPPVPYYIPPTEDNATTRMGGAGANSLAVADFNGDGRPDLAVGHSVWNWDMGGIVVLLNSGTWTPGAVPAPADQPAPAPPAPGPPDEPGPVPPKPHPHQPHRSGAHTSTPWIPKLHAGHRRKHGRHHRHHRHHRRSAQRVARLTFRLAR